MGILPIRRAILGVAVLLGIIAAAQAQVYRGVRYTLPAGWTERNEGGSKVLVPDGLWPGDVLLVLLTGATPASGEPERHFETAVANANRDVGVIVRGPLSSTARRTGRFLVQVYQVETKDLGRHMRVYAMLLEAGKRVFAIVIVKPDSIFPRFQPAVVALFDSLRLDAPSDRQ